MLYVHQTQNINPADNPFGIWGINSLVKAFVEYPSGKKLPFVHGVDWLKVVEPLKMREYTTKKFKMDGDVFDFLESLHYPSMRGIRATVIRKQVCQHNNGIDYIKICCINIIHMYCMSETFSTQYFLCV